MNDIREALFESLFQIAEDYDINLTNSPDMRPGVPEIGDFCGDIEKAVLAAGYVKPRTITTVEELGTVYAGALLVDANGDQWGIDGSTDRLFMVEDGKGDTYNDEALPLPVTVLHEGQA